MPQTINPSSAPRKHQTKLQVVKTDNKSTRRRGLRVQPEPFPFLNLPGEIRNKIYALVFHFDGFVLIGRTRNAHEKPEKVNQREDLPPKRVRLGCLLSCSTISTQPWIQPHLLRVCRRTRDEATSYFYSNITFRFDSMAAINKFLNIAPRRGIQAITRLILTHSTYGEPELTAHREWKKRHDRKWMKTCKRIAEEMTGVAKLKTDLRINDWPTQLNLAAGWAKPLLLLKGKDFAAVTLHCGSFSEQRLRSAAGVVSRALTNDKGLKWNGFIEDANIKKIVVRGNQAARESPKASRVLIIKPTVEQTKSPVMKARKPEQKPITWTPPKRDLLAH